MNNTVKQALPFVADKILDPMGISILNRLFPEDFELYLVALEVRDDEDLIEPIKELLVFPVNPESLMLIQRKMVEIKKSFQGIHINDVDTFIPMPISITGTFGKSFKILFGGSKVIQYKTGFGVTKILKNIVDLSKRKNQSGKPYRVIFYNLPFGGNEVYTVEINECRFNQSMQNNMMWNYDLSMTAVAPGNIGTFTDLTSRLNNLVTIGALQKIVNATYNEGKSLLANAITR